MIKKREENYFSQLIVDETIKPPKAFAKQIASVALQSPSNSFEEGYEIGLTATFGKDYITLHAENIKIEVELQIKQAEINISFPKSNPSFTEKYNNLVEESEREIELRTEATSAAQTGLASNTTLTASAGTDGKRPNVTVDAKLRMDGEKTNAHNTESRSQKRQKNYTHPNVDTLIIGDYSQPYHLSGVEVANYQGWKIYPVTKEAKSGVVASLRVKKHWTKFSDPTIHGDGSEISRRISNLISSGEDNLKAQLFPVLVENLVFHHLQDRLEEEYATIAADAFILSPSDGQMYNYVPDEERRIIPITSRVIERFLESTDEEAESIANNPVNYEADYLLDRYEFPELSPIELLSVIGSRFSCPNKFIGRSSFHTNKPAACATDLKYMAVPYSITKNGLSVDVDNERVEEIIFRHASDTRIMREAYQLYSFKKFEEKLSKRFFKFVIQKVTKARSEREEISDFFKNHFRIAFGNSITESDLALKVEIALQWFDCIAWIREGKGFRYD